ncbi:MAG: substrate-binding domain-containing protein [Ruminococcus sp.]|nr:substrate-binding domain-containing protein [Ruminococcus sp.]
MTALSLAAVCGCANKKKDSAAQETKTEPAPPFSALGEVVEGRRDIYVIVKNMESSYWKAIIQGAEDAGALYDCNIYLSGSYAETDWESQERLMDEALAAGADALVLAPNDSVKLSAKIDEVYDSGLPVIFIDTVANTNSYDICYMTDNLMAGQQAAEEMLYQLRGRGLDENSPLLVGIQVGSTSSQTINERLAGFSQYWNNNAPEGWEIISDIKCNEGNADKAVDCANELIDEYPEVKGVFGSNNGSTAGFAKVVKERGRTDITVVGFDYSDSIADLIASEDYSAATMIQRQYDMALLGVQAALSILDGGSYEVKFVDTGIAVVNGENIETPEIQQLLEHN